MSQSNHMLKTEHQKRIEAFMALAGQVVPGCPMVPDEGVRLLRASLIFEEALETIEALGFEVHPDVGDGGELRGYEFVVSPTNKPNIIEVADGIADISVVSIGTLSAFGIADGPLLKEVDRSNLRKFGPGGYRRPDGKWCKPPDWQKPDIKQVLKEQGYEDS